MCAGRRAELHRAPPKEMESGYEIEDDAQDNETRFYKLPFGQGEYEAEGRVGVRITLRALDGDPDLYVSQASSSND